MVDIVINWFNSLSAAERLVLLYAVSGVFSALLSRRSQVDAWAERNPRLAAVLKLMRATGLDPWMVIQSASLAIKGRLPAMPKTKPTKTPPTGTTILLGLLAVCCASSPPKPPCDEATAAKMAAECAVRAELECVQKGIAEEDCPVVKECDEAADKRQKECLR